MIEEENRASQYSILLYEVHEEENKREDRKDTFNVVTNMKNESGQYIPYPWVNAYLIIWIGPVEMHYSLIVYARNPKA